MDNKTSSPNVRAEQLSQLMKYFFGSDNPMAVGTALLNMKKAYMAQQLYNSVQNENNMSDINMRVDDIEKSADEFSKSDNVNMDEMAENPQFIRYLINNGLSVKDAYYLIKRDSLDSDNLKRAREEITASILAKKNRISENAALMTASHPKGGKKARDLSGEEIDDIIKRVKKGEKISF